MSGLTIREARHADAAGIALLCGQLGYPASTEAVKVRLDHFVGSGDVRLFVAVEGDADRIVGVETVQIRNTLHHDEPMAQITMLVVDEGSRGTGAGRALVDVAEAWARERGCERIVVTTALHRVGAHGFYETLGYEHTGRRYGKTLPGHGN